MSEWLQAVFPDPCLQRKFGFFLNIEEHPDGVVLMFSWMHAELLESSTQEGVRTLHWTVLTGTRDPTFVELETSQNLPGTLKFLS